MGLKWGNQYLKTKVCLVLSFCYRWKLKKVSRHYQLNPSKRLSGSSDGSRNIIYRCHLSNNATLPNIERFCIVTLLQKRWAFTNVLDWDFCELLMECFEFNCYLRSDPNHIQIFICHLVFIRRKSRVTKSDATNHVKWNYLTVKTTTTTKITFITTLIDVK